MSPLLNHENTNSRRDFLKKTTLAGLGTSRLFKENHPCRVRHFAGRGGWSYSSYSRSI